MAPAGNVATALNTAFNSGDALPSKLAPLLNLTGGSLSRGLSQLDGEVSIDAELGAIQLMNEFLNLMLDPFVDGRLGGGADGGGVGNGRAMSFAPDAQTVLPPEVALAYDGVLKAPPPAPFQRRWTIWGASYGGDNTTSGVASAGSSNVAAATYGFAAGMDYHYSPDTIFGFALGGAGTNWDLLSGMGAGRSDAFQTGVYAITRSGPAYVAGALAFANHWFTTNRSALRDLLTAKFDGQSWGRGSKAAIALRWGRCYCRRRLESRRMRRCRRKTSRRRLPARAISPTPAFWAVVLRR